MTWPKCRSIGTTPELRHFRAGSSAQFQVEIPPLAATTLREGREGYFSERAEGFRVKEILSVGAAYTQVTGNEGPSRTFNTLVTATVEKLNVLDMIRADVVTARLVGEYHADDYGHFKGPWITPLGSTFVNLRVAGKLIEPKLPPEFTYSPRVRQGYDLYRKRRMEEKGEPQESEIDSGRIQLPGFGTVILAALTVRRHPDPNYESRVHRLVMMTVEMGSPVRASANIGDVETNGGGWP